MHFFFTSVRNRRALFPSPTTVFFWVTSNPHIALTRALSQSGLTYKKQRELHLQMAQDLERGPADRFPDAPRNYIARVRDLLFSVFPLSSGH